MLNLIPRPRVLPGFGLTLGFTLVYLSLIVLIPPSAVAIICAAMPTGSLNSARRSSPKISRVPPRRHPKMRWITTIDSIQNKSRRW
jgi:hypothetical protein